MRCLIGKTCWDEHLIGRVVQGRGSQSRSKASGLDNWKDGDTRKRRWGKRIKMSRFQKEGDKFSFRHL